MKSIIRTPLHVIRQSETDAAVKDQNIHNFAEEKEVLKDRVDMVEGVLQEVLLNMIE